MAQQEITPAQRAMLFAQNTRQNLQTLPSVSTSSFHSNIQFNMPKARLLSKIILAFEVKIKAKGDVGSQGTKQLSFLDSELGIYNLISRISLDLNNGFSPFVVKGRDLAIYNMIQRKNSDFYSALSVLNNEYAGYARSGLGRTFMRGNGVVLESVNGITNTYKFSLELPVTLNDKEPTGLILLQNDQTVVTCDIAVSDFASLINNEKTDGSGLIYENCTYDLQEFKVTPVLETFSIPANGNAFPDLSVLKLVNSRQESLVGGGQHIIKLSTGNIYRRIIFTAYNEDGTPMSDEDFTSNISLVFNQADTNYDLPAEILSRLNTMYYGIALPKGVYVFDFAYQGNVNISGSRDYIDTERLTEFWLRFSTNSSAKLDIMTETLSRLV